MSNAKTGIWSALGALVGGLAGAAAGRYAAEFRPRGRYEYGPEGASVEDAMVVGGAAGSVIGAFVGGMVGGEEPPPAGAPPQIAK